MRNVELPPAVRSKSPGSLVALVIHSQLELFLRETDWGLKRYPSACPAELRLGSWEIDNVVLVALILRLARSDASTFDCQIDVCTPAGTRVLQCLAGQNQVDVHLAGDQTIRTLRATNPAAVDASYLIDKVRSRTPWTPEELEHALGRLNTLYPTSRDLWWNCTSGDKP